MGVTIPLPIWVQCLRVRVRVDKKTPGGHPCHTLDVLIKSMKTLRLEAKLDFATNSNLNPFGIILNDGCEEDGKENYPDDSHLGAGEKYKEHTFKDIVPELFINTPPDHGLCTKCFDPD